MKRDRNKGQYSVDLSTLHATCESNYRRLLQLFPEYETANSREFQLEGGVRVRIDVVERCRYTTLMHVQQQGSRSPWLFAPCFDLRAYHDARMAEVTSFQSQRHIAARYDYPNNRMHAPDEKSQQNFFLAEWLAYCLAEGHSNHPLPLSSCGEVTAP